MHKTRLQISSEGTSRVCDRSLTLASMYFLSVCDVLLLWCKVFTSYNLMWCALIMMWCALNFIFSWCSVVISWCTLLPFPTLTPGFDVLCQYKACVCLFCYFTSVHKLYNLKFVCKKCIDHRSEDVPPSDSVTQGSWV